MYSATMSSSLGSSWGDSQGRLSHLAFGRSALFAGLSSLVFLCSGPSAFAEGSQDAAGADTNAPPAPCSSPESSQFDFWIGEWDLTWPDGAGISAGKGRNTITSELGGCVVEENFAAPELPFHGRSLSVYDANAGVWKQTWVDDSGGYLDFTGGMEGDRMILGRDAVVGGKNVKQRMVFFNIKDSSFDWDWEVSTDGGETWLTRWQIHYERRNT